MPRAQEIVPQSPAQTKFHSHLPIPSRLCDLPSSISLATLVLSRNLCQGFLPSQNNTSKMKSHPNPHTAENLDFSRDSRCETGLVCSFRETPQCHSPSDCREHDGKLLLAPLESSQPPSLLPSCFPCSVSPPLILQEQGTAFPTSLAGPGSPVKVQLRRGCDLSPQSLGGYVNKSAFAL